MRKIWENKTIYQIGIVPVPVDVMMGIERANIFKERSA